jgi:hypothetical protein
MFDFGCSVFDFMIGKHDLNKTPHLLQDSGIKEREEVMPLLESLPPGWTDVPELASLLQILHLSLVIDINQNTAETF